MGPALFTRTERLTFFARFNKIIVLTYAVVILCASLLFGLLFKENYASRLNDLQLRLQEQSRVLNYLIRVRADAIHALQIQAQDYLGMISEETPRLPRWLQESADGTYYHLDNGKNTEIVGNLVGKGDLKSLTQDQQREIQMAYNLNPQFHAIRSYIKTVTGLYYMSASGFENHFPWRPSYDFPWMFDKMKSRFLANLSTFNLPYGDLNWSDVYLSPQNNNLIVTCAAPVHRNEEFLGIIAIDFTLEAFNDFVTNIINPYGRLLVVNNYQTVIADTNSKNPDNTIIVKTQQAFSPSLSLEKINKIPRKEMTRLEDHWVFQVSSRYAPWTLIYYVPTSVVLWTTLEETGPAVLFLFIFAVVILRGANTLIFQEFIQPAHRLVGFITNRAQEGDEGYKDVRDPWHRWFEAVNGVFQENKQLIERFELNIRELDSMVHDRTRELSTKNLALTKALTDLKKAQNQMIFQEKLAGLGALTAGIAHEIKNPLNYVINFAELSREYIEEINQLIDSFPPEHKEHVDDIMCSLTHNLQRIEDHGKRADGIIRNMLMHARAGEVSLDETKINDLINENTQLAISGLRKQGFVPKVCKAFDENLPLIKTYRQDLGRVILNIVNNACYALHQKKSELGPFFEPEIRLKTYFENNSVYIRLWDNGPGMTEKVRKSIFVPFFTTKPAGSGTGLGLSLSYEIITQQHHGTLVVESVLGDHTEFIITLPVE